MLIAHAPTGYIVSKTLNKKSKTNFVVFSLIFSLWPDLDLFYYYFFDKAVAFHHTYFTHLPIVMFISFFITLPLTYISSLRNIKPYYYLFFINWALHLVLDTFTGGILWLYPFSQYMFLFIKIPPISQNWIISFIFHWSFILELIIVIWSVILLYEEVKNENRSLFN